MNKGSKKLKQYLTNHNLRGVAAVRHTELSRNTLSRLLQGEVPKDANKLKLQDKTQGFVKATDWLVACDAAADAA